MEDKEKQDIEQKIKDLDKELDSSNVSYVWMLKNGVVTDEKSVIATAGIATCVGIAVSVTDSSGKVHRIVAHNSYTGEKSNKMNEEAIEYYLKELEPIEKLDAMFCSMDSFTDFDNLDEREQEILNGINKMFEFYKEQHPDFQVPFHRSWYVKISPDGNFEYADDKMVEVYKEMKAREEERIKREQKLENVER